MSHSDLFLFERWTQSRDAEAFAEIVSRYSGMVYATARRVLRNGADAEEVAQECFLELARGRVKVRSSLGGWLHRAATHCAVDRIRGEARRRRHEADHLKNAETRGEADWAAIQ